MVKIIVLIHVSHMHSFQANKEIEMKNDFVNVIAVLAISRNNELLIVHAEVQCIVFRG